MKARELRATLRRLGCAEVRQKGSHLTVRCGKCQTTIPVHAGEDIAPGTLRAIVKALDPCLGDDWLGKR
jgi:predicted RNA binding protein YcfA (HicA-like mRNA interferase family)